MFLYRFRMVQGLWQIDRENNVAFAHLCGEKCEQNVHFLQRILSLRKCMFTLHGVLYKEDCRIMISQRTETVYESTQNFPTLTVPYVISKTEMTPPYVLTTVLLLKICTNVRYGIFFFKNMLRYYLSQKDVTVPSFSTAYQLHFQRNFSTGWGFLVKRNSRQIIFQSKARNHVDAEGLNDFVVCRASWFESRDFFLWVYLKDQFFWKLPCSISARHRLQQNALQWWYDLYDILLRRKASRILLWNSRT